jgi:hypothetical protein
VSRKTTSALSWLPSASTGISVTPNAAANTFSAWVEISSGLASDIYVSHISALPNNGSTVSGFFWRSEYEIGVGSAGNEVAVTRAVAVYPSGTQYGAKSSIPVQIVKRIAAGARVTVRMRHSVADVDVYFVALGYYPTLGGNTNVVTGTHVVTPAGSNGVSVTHAASFVFGSWVTVIASVSGNNYLTGFTAYDLSSTQAEIQFGLGSSPADFTTIPWNGNDGNQVCYYPFRYPIWLPNASQLSVRSRASGGDTWDCSVLTVPA